MTKGGAVILLANAHHPGNAPGFYWLTLLISGLSMLLGVLTNYSIAAAQLEQRYVQDAAGTSIVTFLAALAAFRYASLRMFTTDKAARG